MSHEIRTPINAILGMLYLALKNDDLPPGLYNHLSKAQGAAHSLLGLINDILDFSKIEAGKLELENVEFSLNQVLEPLTDVIGIQAGQKGLEFLIRYDVTLPPTLMGDPLRLGQVLLNLCNNAVKFTEQGQIELTLHSLKATDADLTLQVYVRDSGIGMTAEAQARLFEKFTQADQSTTRRFGGTGLGLAISKNLVELMGGRIWVEDSQPGRGTTIGFNVPLRIVQQAQRRRRELVEQAGPLLAGVRVLVVDDNSVSRDILTEMLRFFHLQVESVASGPAALNLLETADPPYDLVLMDWRMPGMNGDEATQRIHRNPAIAPQPKVIIVTAYGRSDVIQRAEQAGVDGFLIKPVSPSTLLDTLLSVLGRGRLLSTDERPAAAMRDALTPHSLSGARLLLVEDNDINREFAGELLRSEGLVVDEAVNGQDALDRVEQTRYDAVLMDLQMPVMDGLEATRRIRALAQQPGGERFAALPIIAMTALATSGDAEHSQAAGMNDYVTKPVAPERLMTVLAQWVRPGLQPELSAMQLPAEAPAPAAQLPEDLLALTHLDARSGVRRIGGKVEAYRKQLRRFREHYANAASQLQQLAGEQGASAAEAYCHALKGVAGNLSAEALYEQVALIDAGLKQGTLPDAAVLAELETRLRAVLADIDRLDSVASPAPTVAALPLNPAALDQRLERLAEALNYDLGAAEPLLQELCAGVSGSAWEAEIAALAAQVDVFAIDEALVLLRALQERLKSAS